MCKAIPNQQKRDADTYRTDRRGSRNTLRLSRLPYVKYLPRRDIPVYKIGRAARRAFLDRRCNDNTRNETKCFFARKRYFRVLRLFFAYFFLARQKKVCPRSDSYSVAVKTALRCNRRSVPRVPFRDVPCLKSPVAGSDTPAPHQDIFRGRRGSKTWQAGGS